MKCWIRRHKSFTRDWIICSSKILTDYFILATFLRAPSSAKARVCKFSFDLERETHAHSGHICSQSSEKHLWQLPSRWICILIFSETVFSWNFTPKEWQKSLQSKHRVIFLNWFLFLILLVGGSNTLLKKQLIFGPSELFLKDNPRKNAQPNKLTITKVGRSNAIIIGRSQRSIFLCSTARVINHFCHLLLVWWALIVCLLYKNAPIMITFFSTRVYRNSK